MNKKIKESQKRRVFEFFRRKKKLIKRSKWRGRKKEERNNGLNLRGNPFQGKGKDEDIAKVKRGET